MEPATLKGQIRAWGLALGFCRVGFCGAGPLPHAEALRRWLQRGLHGELAFLARDPAARAEPRSLLPGARSAVVVAASYRAPEDRLPAPPPPPGFGRVARYARGVDYHGVVRVRLAALVARLERALGGPLPHRIAVDTSPLLERELAVAAGIGFQGKNTLLITPGLGSYTVLGVLLLPLWLPPDRPLAPRCGTCRRCLEACPTAALCAPYTLDAGRCASALTVEQRGPLDAERAARLSPWVFGCDACQEACPYNRGAARGVARAPELAPEQALDRLELAALMGLRAGEYRRLVRGRALRRASRWTLARNAALAAADPRHLGHGPTRRALEALDRCPDEGARRAAALALSMVAKMRDIS